jgi:ankyrin repeat protein
MLKTKPFDEFESLILREHGNVYHIMQKIAHFEYIIERRVGFIAECHRLYLLFDWDHYRNSDFKGGVRVISWIINYGHTHLLKEIVKHVECNKHNISLIFGSNLMENIRLLTLGCYSNTSDMVELMLEYIDSKCINMDYSTSFDIANFVPRIYTPLMVACATGNLCIVKALLRNKADVNECSTLKETPLLIAISYGHADVVRCLLSSGADVNLCNSFRRSPLYKASKKGHCDIVKYLVDHKADVNLYGANRQSPLYKASKKGHCDIVKYLVAHNAKVNLCDLQGQSPLFKASMEGHCDIVKYLVDHNADVNLCDLHGQSPLLKASMEGYCDIVKYLVANNADVNLTDIDDRSPLFPASKVGHYSIVHVLLQNGADVGYDSALDLALYYGHHDIVSLLIAHGALSAGNTKSQFKSISKRTNGNEIHSDNNALLNPCGYPEEKISHSKEKQEEKKEGIYVAKVQEGKKETVFTREQEEKEEIISTRETKE